MDNPGSTDKAELYERPFKPDEHGFNNGNVYILKAALRRRLNEIDSKWRTSDPEIMATVGDVVLMRGCLILQGASRTAVGTGIIITTKKTEDVKTKAVSYEPLPAFELARNLAKAYKTAASDLLPRLCIEYNIGAYLKAVPKNVRDVSGLTTWLNSLKPVPQKQTPSVTPPPAQRQPEQQQREQDKPEPHFSDDDEKRQIIVNTAIKAGYLTQGQTWSDLLRVAELTDEKVRTFATGNDLGIHVKEKGEALKRQLAAAAITPAHVAKTLAGNHDRIGFVKSPFDTPTTTPDGDNSPAGGSKFARGLDAYKQQQEQARIDAANAELDKQAARASANDDIPSNVTSPHYHKKPDNGAVKTMLDGMPTISGN